jgi:hypothetical protein
MKRITFGTLGLVGLFTAAAFAWFVLGNIEGTGTAKAGKATPTVVPITVVFHEGLTPTTEEPIEHITVNSPAGAPLIEAKKMTFTFTDSGEPTCAASNFSIIPTGTGHFEPVNFWAGKEYVAGHYFNVGPGPSSFEVIGNTASTWEANVRMAAEAPAACEGVEVHLKVKIN